MRDPARVFEVRAHEKSFADEPFDAKVVTQFRTPDVLADLDVRALAAAGSTIYAGTASGLFRTFDTGDRFERVPLASTGTRAVSDLYALQDGALLVAAGERVVRLDASGVEVASFSVRGGMIVRAVAPATPNGDAIYAAADRGLVRFDAAGSSTVSAAFSLEIRDLLAVPGAPELRLAIAAKTGLFLFDPSSPLLVTLSTRTEPGDEPRALAPDPADPDIGLWLASDQTLSAISFEGDVFRVIRPGLGGLPEGSLTALATGPDHFFAGHAIGASSVMTSRPEHFHSLRWIPAEDVRAVAIGSDGARWIGTSAGVARIALEKSTLRAKADALDAMLEPVHLRMDGFVDDDVGFDSPYDHSAGPHHWDNDNDGLWTEMQIGAWCFAYAVTGEPRSKAQARRALEVMFLEIDVPGETFAAMGRPRGFITRSLVREDETALFENKREMDNWHLQEFGGKKYYWKSDTSSDEYAGHYFGLPVYYDLCADDGEKEEIRSRLRLTTDYIIQGNYQLIDLGGQPTSFGRWDDLAAAVDGLDGCPDHHELAACLNSWGGGGWLNGLEVLGMLLATWHVTGDQRYYDEYERLYTDEKYGRLIPIAEHTLTVTSPHFANHSDHELATLAYFTLLRYEPNPDRRELAIQSFRDFYEHEREEHNPWQVATLASAYAPDVDLDGAITSLHDMPLDRRNWLIDNDHRVDAGRWPDDRAGSPQFDRVFPYDEINALKWNSDPYNVHDGAQGYDVISPTPYLIAYWMARYFGLITD